MPKLSSAGKYSCHFSRFSGLVSCNLSAAAGQLGLDMVLSEVAHWKIRSLFREFFF